MSTTGVGARKVPLPMTGGRLIALSAPLKVSIVLTDRCNLRCLHCGVAEIEYSEPELEYEGWLEVCQQLEEAQVFRAHLSGGEIFVLPWIFKLLEAFHKHKVSIEGINTNGTLLTSEKVKRLAACLTRKERFVQVSLDGPNAVVHDALRGAGAFVRAMDGIRLLRENGFRVGLFSVVNKFNCDTLPAIVDKALELGGVYINFNKLGFVGRASQYPELEPAKDQIVQAAADLHAKMAITPKGFISGAWPNYATRIVRGDEYFSPEDTAHKAGCSTSCRTAFSECAIGPTGRMAPCDMALSLASESLVGPHARKLKDIWRESPLFEAVRGTYGKSLSDIADCNTCAHHKGCAGMCPAAGSVARKQWPSIVSSECYFFKRGRKACESMKTAQSVMS
jgi:radical SAM protein with 4Fe4S-binding SPASM domain